MHGELICMLISQKLAKAPYHVSYFIFTCPATKCTAEVLILLYNFGTRQHQTMHFQGCNDLELGPQIQPYGGGWVQRRIFLGQTSEHID